MKPFKAKQHLNPDFFKDEQTMDSQIRMRLLDIADDFIKTLEVKWIKPTDIIVTGSIVNYNWSEYSDVDVHIIYDFNKIYKKSDFVSDYFMSKRDGWNNSHENLTIKGFPVEVSVEDKNSPLQSSGVYSIEKNKWVKKPKELDDSGIDMKGVQKYCAKQMTKMDKIFTKMDKEKDRKKLETLGEELESIIDEIHSKRKTGLKTKAKEMSNGNIMWKVVKHMGYVEKAYDYLNKVYDRRNTINENIDYDKMKTIILTESQVKQLKEHAYGWNNEEYNFLKKYLPDFNKIVDATLTAKDLNEIHTIFDAYYDRTSKYDKFKGRYRDSVVQQILKNQTFRNELRAYFDRPAKPTQTELQKLIQNQKPIYYRPEYKKQKKDSDDYYMPAADMENFIKLDDVSELNEYRQYLNSIRK